MSVSARYQVYLDPRSVAILDEASELLPVTRSQIIREAIDAAAGRVSNLLALLKPVSFDDYSWIDKMTGSLIYKDGKTVNMTERVDSVYHDK